MKKTDDFNYFDAYAKQVRFAYEIVCNLRSALDSPEFGSRELMDALHTMENDADQVNHDIQNHLTRSFVVPFERGSMARLAHVLDNVSDAAEDIAIQAYCLHCRVLTPGARAMVDALVGAVEALGEAVDALRAGRGGAARLREGLLQVQALESECDRLYIDELHALYDVTALGGEEGEGAAYAADAVAFGTRFADVAEARRIAHALLSTIETATDATETAAECLETIVKENA